MKRDFSEKGSMTLETALLLPIFFFMFLFVFCFFGFISARNQIHHALIQSAKSLSMDSYFTENVESAAESGTKFWGDFADMIYDLVRLDIDPSYASSSDWYKSTSNEPVIRKRFVGFIAGSEGEDAAQKRLKSIGVEDGLDGIVFEYSVTDGDLEITAKYNLKVWFNFFGVGSFPMEDTVTVKMWGFDESSAAAT